MNTIKSSERELLGRLARSWNHLEVRFIEAAIADDVIYQSQWVVLPIEGKQPFLFYLTAKFRAIRLAMEQSEMRVTAELTALSVFPFRPSILLTQVSREETVRAVLFIRTEGAKIKRIDLRFPSSLRWGQADPRLHYE